MAAKQAPAKTDAAVSRATRGTKRSADAFCDENNSRADECHDPSDPLVFPGSSGQKTVSTATPPVDQMGLVNKRIDLLFEEIRGLRRNSVSPSPASAFVPAFEPRAKGSNPHDMSPEEGETSDSNDATLSGDASTPMTPSVTTPTASIMQYVNSLTNSPDDQATGIAEDLTRVLKELSSVFQGNEEKGKNVDDTLAKIFNDGLRARPLYGALKTTMDKYKAPGNIPNLNAPATNEDVTSAMNKSAQLLDSQLLKNGGLLAKGMVPLIYMINDIANKKDKPLGSYIQELNDCMVMLMAAFNYICLTRVDVARINVRDSGFNQLCRDKSMEIGTDQIFPVDVTVRSNELAKRRKLGQFKQFQNQRRGSSQGYHTGYHGDKREGYKKDYKNYPSKGKHSSNTNYKPDYKPANFLGWKQPGKGKFNKSN